ncbi:hypothetical protein PUN28_013007 [Cardiocondyla obscurior]|uniref:Uncharacterized protein n=1 Tax=Cardiocondyla obscurior TaxID=286306 RepID=A0AAW2FAF8_9HYME
MRAPTQPIYRNRERHLPPSISTSSNRTARVARPSSSVPTWTCRSSSRFPFSLSRPLINGSPSAALDVVSLAAHRRGAPRARSLSRSSPIYSSAVDLFVLLFLFRYPISFLFFCSPFANSGNKCLAVLLIAFPALLLFYRAPCSTTPFVISSRGPEFSGFFNLLIILLRFLSNQPRPLPHSRHRRL